MSRSYKKTPFFSHCGAGNQKEYRSQENRAKRSQIKQLLTECRSLDSFDDVKFERNHIHEKEYGNEWSSPRDGKSFWEKPEKGRKDKMFGFGSIDCPWDWYELWLKSMRK